jgi:hypothetical protein
VVFKYPKRHVVDDSLYVKILKLNVQIKY